MSPYGEFIVEYELEHGRAKPEVKRAGVGHNWNESKATDVATQLEDVPDMGGVRIGRVTIMHFDPARGEYRKW